MRSHSPSVAHVINRLAPGGAERQLVELTRRSELRHSIVELGASGERPGGVLSRVGRELRAVDADVVVAWLERPQLAVAAAYFGRAPLIANVRGLPRRTGRLERALLRTAFARYDHFVANSAASRAATRAFALPLRLPAFDVIPNGVEQPQPPPPRSSGQAAFRIGFIGRADWAKGVDVILAALALLDGDNVEAVLVGAGVPEVAATVGLDRLGIVALPRTEDAWAAVGTIDALVVPSRSEGSPNVVIEAFARGVPVIATDVGGASELLAAGRGRLVARDDPEALAAAIRSVAADETGARRAADVAARYVATTHTWPRVIAGYDVLLRRLAGR